MTCSKCGKSLELQDSQFCPNCGATTQLLIPLGYMPPPVAEAAIIRRRFERNWRTMRWLYYFTLFLIVSPYVFYFGPNYINFGQWTWVTPAYFAPLVAQEFASEVRQIKQFQMDHGRLPDFKEADKLIGYWKGYSAQEMEGSVLVIMEPTLTFRHATIKYEFNPASEGWSIESPWATGPIPAPLVTIQAAIDPSSRPQIRGEGVLPKMLQ